MYQHFQRPILSLMVWTFIVYAVSSLHAQEFKQDMASQRWMYVSEKGKPDKSIMYDTVKSFYFGWAPVRYLGRWGCINSANKWVIDPLYDDLDIMPGEVVRVKSGASYGIVDFKGQVLLPVTYDAVDHYLDGYGTVKSEGTWYALTPEGLQQEDIIFQFPHEKAYILGCDPGDYDCCTEKMAESIFTDIRYPALARENGIQGTVILSAVIDEGGRMTRHTVVRGIYPPCDEEAMRVFQRMDFTWIPAVQDGKKVLSRIFFPIRFRLGR